MSTRAKRLPSGFNYAFRPTSYFRNIDFHTLIVSSILGEERRKDVQARLMSGDADEYGDWLTESKLDDSTRQVVGSMHPAFMGGEYLPNIGGDEIEIARIVLASVTQDVISIRAKRTKKNIAYRVVDEYDSVFKVAKKWSSKPLSLRELIYLIDGTGQDGGLVFSILSMNINYGGEDADGMRGFVAVSSSFYPELGRYYDFAIDTYLDGFAVEEDEDDDDDGLVVFPATKQPWDLQNLPEDPASGAVKASEVAFAARSNSGVKKPE